MFNNVIPEYRMIGAPIRVSTWTTPPTNLTVPPGANGLLVQASTQAVYIEFDGNSITSDSLQIPTGQAPIVLRLSSERKVSFNQVTSGAILIYRWVSIVGVH